jgi:hypothetical protein
MKTKISIECPSSTPKQRFSCPTSKFLKKRLIRVLYSLVANYELFEKRAKIRHVGWDFGDHQSL